VVFLQSLSDFNCLQIDCHVKPSFLGCPRSATTFEIGPQHQASPYIAQTRNAECAVGHNDLSQSFNSGSAQMAKSAPVKVIEQKGVAQKAAKQRKKKKYARELTAEDYKTFPPGFRDYKSYPAEEILKVKGAGGPVEKRKYWVRWTPHPLTGEEFKPTWVSFLFNGSDSNTDLVQVDHKGVSSALLASWEEKKRSQEKPETVIIRDDEDDNADKSPVAGIISSHANSRRRRYSESDPSDKAGKEEILDGTIRRQTRQKSRRIISDGSSEAEPEEEARTQSSSTLKSQNTASTSTSSLRSPPPEIEDSQELAAPFRSISVIVPPVPSQAEDFVPINSSRELESSSQILSTLEVHPSTEATASDYPTPDSEQPQSPAFSDASSGLFFPEVEASPQGSRSNSQTTRQKIAPAISVHREAIEPPTTQRISNESQGSVQILASDSVVENSQQTRLPSAQPTVEPPTSEIKETQTSIGPELESLDQSIDFQTPHTHQSEEQQPQTQLPSSAGARLSVENPSQTSVSPSKRQGSSSQPPKQSLFRTLHQEGIESWPSSQQESSRSLLQSPIAFPEADGKRRDKAASIETQSGSSLTAPLQLSKPLTDPLAAMAAPSHRSSPRTARASTPSRTSRGTTMTLQEQLAQSRAARQRKAVSASPVDAPTPAPLVPQIHEPTPVRLATRTSNPTLPKVETPGLLSSSAMQVDESPTSEAPNQAANSISGETTSVSNLYIQQSIEMDEPDKPNDTQDSSAPESSDPQENGHGIHSLAQGLMPNFPILLPGEFAIPLHAEGKTQHAYQDALQAKQKALSKYLRRGSSSSTPSSNGLVTPKTEANEMAALIGCLDNIISLIDLGYDGMMTQSSYTSSQLAEWAVKISSKFAFVRALIDALQGHDSSIIVFARAGQTQQVFENFLSDAKVDIRTYTSSGDPALGITAQGKCTVHLVAAGQKPNIALKPGPSLIIAFDTSYDPRSDYVLDLRGDESKQIPVIHLLVSNSSEHIDRCLPVNMPSPQRNRLLMQTILRGASHMGKILSEESHVTHEYYSLLSGGTRMYDDDLQRKEQTFMKMPDFHLKQLALQVAKALLSKEFSFNWSTLPPMPPLKLDDIPGLMTQQLRLPSPSPVPPSPIGTPSLRKRLLDGDVLDSPGGSKRQRLTPLPGASPHEHSDASYIHHLQHALKAAKDEAANEKLARMGAEDERDKSRAKLNEWRQSVSELQKRVEYHRDQDHKCRTKIRQLNTEAERFTQLRERDATERDVLKAQVVQFKEELARARQDLKDAGGETAALEHARNEARVASAALAKTQKELASAKQQGDYFALQYRETMTTGRQYQADAEELQSKIKSLEIEASDEKRRLKLVNFDEAAKVHLDHIEKLELENKALEAMVKKLNAENTSLKANRGVSTRASSVQPPGSPRARETKSRGGSPVRLIPGLMAAAAYAGSRASALRHERS
jgi:Class II histone deacetylase complex subunits 2 and 3